MTTRTQSFSFTGWFTQDGDRATRDQVAHSASSLVRRWHSDCGRWRVDFSAQSGANIWQVDFDADGDRNCAGWAFDGGWDFTNVTDAFAWCRWRANRCGF